MKCSKCGQEVDLPFTCTYCGEAFCDEHRLPESHECRMLPKDSKFWYRKKRLGNVNEKYGICPNCGSQSSQMTNYDAKTMTYQCKECGQKYTKLKSSPNSYVEPRNNIESYQKPRKRRHFPVRKVISAILAIMIVGVILGGFGYAYTNKLNMFNQTENNLESLGYTISNNVSGVDLSTVINAGSVIPMVDFSSFLSIARQYNTTTIYEDGSSFYVITVWTILVTAYKYTPSNSIWWIWG